MIGRALHRQPRVDSTQPQEQVLRPVGVRHLYQEGTGSVRFVSVLDFSKVHRFGSVRFIECNFPSRRGSACVFRTHRGSALFGSVPRPVPASFKIERFGTDRFGRCGLVSDSFLL